MESNRAETVPPTVYTVGSIALRGVLADVYVCVCLVYNDFAKSLLFSFVHHFSELFGAQFVVYKIHGLVHLC